MTRLYNHTRYADAVVRKVFNFAARALGVKGDVPVKITYSDRARTNGVAYCSWPYRKTLIGKPSKSKDKRILKCPIGWIKMSLPRSAHEATFLTVAERFVDVAIHEMSHILDYRRGVSHTGAYAGYSEGRRPGQRRMKHDRRPCEITAENRVYELRQDRVKDKRRQNLVLELAVELEAQNQR